jgi:hypothetical protein
VREEAAIQLRRPILHQAKAAPVIDDADDRIAALQRENAELRKKLASAEAKLAVNAVNDVNAVNARPRKRARDDMAAYMRERRARDKARKSKSGRPA